MQISILAIGRLKHPAETEIILRYQKRFSALGRKCGLGPLDISEFPESKLVSINDRLTNEAERLLKAAKPFEYAFLLDIRGNSLSSLNFARKLQSLTNEGIKTCAFIIGGPDGCGADIFTKVPHRLSVSSLTLSHALARVVLTEQLYRAATILTGHPYHRE